MSSVEAHLGVGRASARAAVSAPPWMWIGVAVAVAALAWQVCRVQADDTPDWLDPNQPPVSTNLDFSTSLLGTIATVPGQATGGFRRRKPYPWASLMTHPDCWVGDC